MRAATYNIWNDDAGQEKRAAQILGELRAVRADVVSLQEVTERFFQAYLGVDCGFPHSVFFPYDGEDEGLAILSRYPVEDVFFLHESLAYSKANALNVIVRVEDLKISITNLHLPWDSVRRQEKQIVEIDRYIHSQGQKADFFVLLGDFNGNINSSVHRFLLGDQTIEGHESNPYWNDLQSGYCARTRMPLTATLDFIGNPRWRGRNTVSAPMVADRIYVMESWSDIEMKELRIFGMDVYGDTGMCASDHYGVVAELQFKK